MSPAIPTPLIPALALLKERLVERYGARLREVRLFGSHARGEAHEESDVDVLVLVDGLTDREIGEVATIAAEVLIETDVLLSPLPMSTERLEALRRAERSLAANLDREGIPV